MIKKLLKKCSELNTETKTWIGQAIGGAFAADGKIDHNEILEIMEFLREYKSEKEITSAIGDILDREHPVYLKSIQLPEDLAVLVFKTVLKMCASDYELHPSEIHYLNHIGSALSINIQKRLKLVRSTIKSVKMDFFTSMIAELYGEERYWLAAVIIKTIYADGRVDPKEIPYLNSIYDLLGETPDQIEAVKAESKNLSIDHLPTIRLPKDLSKRILKYLLEITMDDNEFDEREINFIRQVSENQGISDDDLEELTKEVERQNNEIAKLTT